MYYCFNLIYFIYLFISIEDRDYTTRGLGMLVIWLELKSFEEKTIGSGTT